MRGLFNILSYKYLWYIKYFIYGMVIFWNFNYLIRTDGNLQARLVKYRQLNKEVVPEKNACQLVVPGDALLFNRSGDTLGCCDGVNFCMGTKLRDLMKFSCKTLN